MSRSKKALVACVVASHCVFMLSLLFHTDLSSKQPKIQRLSVKVIQPLPQKKIQLPSPQKTPEKSSVTAPPKQPKKKPTPPPSQPEKPAAVKTPAKTTPSPKKNAKPVIKKEPPLPSAPPLVSKELIKELQESIAKIDGKQDKLKQESKAGPAAEVSPTPLKSLSSLEKINTPAPSSQSAVKELLMHELHSVLHLPDYGEVKMHLIMRSDGSIAEVKVIKADSKKNKAYLEKELLKHRFPFISEMNLSQETLSFMITFCNEI